MKETKEEMNDVKKTNKLFSDVMDIAAKTGKKSLDAATNVLAQTADKSKELADGFAKGAKDVADKAKLESYNRRMKKYNPLFLEDYNSETFFVPNIIQIVDDAVRRDIDVCQGAIGWRENKRNTEVLFLYDEFAPECGLDFVPMITCDEIYCMDPHNKKRFIKADQIFQRAHEEKLAELEHIAYCLGAKICTIEIEEQEVNHTRKTISASVQGRGTTTESTDDRNVKRISKTVTKFKGNDEVTMPKLKWFSHDDNICNLIEFRMENKNAIEEKTLTLAGSTSATMSRSAAMSVDAAMGELGGKLVSGSMEGKATKENEQRIKYHLEF